jgi:hypothetical protein
MMLCVAAVPLQYLLQPVFAVQLYVRPDHRHAHAGPDLKEARGHG